MSLAMDLLVRASNAMQLLPLLSIHGLWRCELTFPFADTSSVPRKVKRGNLFISSAFTAWIAGRINEGHVPRGSTADIFTRRLSRPRKKGVRKSNRAPIRSSPPAGPATLKCKEKLVVCVSLHPYSVAVHNNVLYYCHHCSQQLCWFCYAPVVVQQVDESCLALSPSLARPTSYSRTSSMCCCCCCLRCTVN